MKSTKLTLVALAVSVAACDDATRPVPPTASDPAVRYLLDAEPPISQVAGALARGLASADARLGILAAMRASTQVEHQLVLGDYLRSPEGTGLLAGSAAALGTEEAEFLARVARLDEVAQLVISVPLREHRLAWRGTPRIGVAGSWDPDVLDFSVHGPAGGRREATKMGQIEDYDAFLYVGPRENWGTRIGRQADEPGAVIQDPDDGEAAVVWTYRVGNAEPLTLDYGRYESEQELEAARTELLGTHSVYQDGQVAGHGYYDPLVEQSPLHLTGFASRFNTEWGREELAITVGYTNVDGVFVSGTAEFGGVRDNTWYRRYKEMLPVSPKRGGANFSVSAVELDGLSRNDDLGWALVTHANGPRTYNLRVGSRLRSQVALSW